ncbi:MAG TPA: family 10 glycosylhydrolase [Bryobacteraceae bacterium]|nr:family 10 glycosylhydrolase [Bryobacteraceae bacterium]
MTRSTLFLYLIAGSTLGQQGWWMNEPIRWVQTNIRQTDAGQDVKRLVGQLADMRANVLLEGMGGIVAYYPTQVPFHYPSPDLPPGHDMFGDVLREAHAKNIRVVGRFDFSKTQKAVFDAHPEWFFRQTNGEPVIYNGLYSTCINGGYYRAQAMKILTEALDKYDVDGLFFNMFGNQSRDYSGREVGLCHCDVCKRLYREKYGKELPDKPDADYRRFMFTSSREVAAAIGDLIHAKRPKAGYFNYIQEYTDGIMSESNTAVARPLPLWPYSASDNVDRARNSQPGKMAINLNMQFVDFWWRFATVPREEIALRSWQNIAHGGALTFETNGTLDLQDRQALEAVRPIFRWVAANEQYYVGQNSLARVLLLGAGPSGGASGEESYRGLFRLLSEEHVPFAVSDNMDWLEKHDYDLVVASDWAPAGLRQYAERGGKVLIVSAAKPEFEIAPVVRSMADVKGYVRVRDHGAFPSLKDTDLLLLNGPFTELEADPRASLTLVPPSLIGPPEFVHIDMKDTNTPAIALRPVGKGTIAWIPWNLAALYYRLSLPAHEALFRDVLDRLGLRRQIRTDAHPLVEMTLMKQESRTLLHLINLSGQSQTGYFPPVPMSRMQIQIAGSYKNAKSVREPKSLPVRVSGGYTEITLPRLSDYELVVLE